MQQDEYEIIQYQQTKKSKGKNQGPISSLKNYMYNSLYWLGSFSSQNIIQSQKSDDSKYFIFGKQLPNKQSALQKIRKIMWITYRNNFPNLLQSKYNSDMGWGCMIRVGQMALAQALKTHASKYFSNSQDSKLNILTSFLDDDEENDKYINYSIQKIVEEAKQCFRLNPGQWFTPAHIGYILQKLHNQKPLRGYQSMRISISNNNLIYYEQILNQMGYNVCTCKKILINCNKCHSDSKDKKAILLIILSRLGLQKPQKQNRNSVMKLLTLKNSLGIIGGSPGRALYIIGRQGTDKLIHLDPHYVQESTSRKNLEQLKMTFVCNNYSAISYLQMDPSLGFIFYIENIKQLQEFAEKLNEFTKQDPGFIIFTQIVLPAIYKRQKNQKNQSVIEKFYRDSISQINSNFSIHL